MKMMKLICYSCYSAPLWALSWYSESKLKWGHRGTPIWNLPCSGFGEKCIATKFGEDRWSWML